MSPAERKRLATKRGVNDVYHNPAGSISHGEFYVGETANGPIFLAKDFKLTEKTDDEKALLREKTIKTVDYRPDPGAEKGYRYRGILIKQELTGWYFATSEVGSFRYKSLNVIEKLIDRVLNERSITIVKDPKNETKKMVKKERIKREIGKITKHSSQREHEIVDGENGQEALVRFKSTFDGAADKEARIKDIELLTDTELKWKVLGLINPQR